MGAIAMTHLIDQSWGSNVDLAHWYAMQVTDRFTIHPDGTVTRH